MITLLAATGYTGQFVAAELHKHHLSFRIAGRSEDRLQKLAASLEPSPEIIVCDIEKPETLGKAFDGANIILNCAGPFTDLGEPVVREAARRGIHYIDTTGEQNFIKLVFEKCGKEAAEKGAALVPAAAYDYAFGDAAAEIVSRGLDPCDEISIAYNIAGFNTSRGTKKSMLRAVSQQGFLFLDGHVVPSKSGDIKRELEFPDGRRLSGVSFPGGEVIQVPPHVRAKNVITFMAVSATVAGVIGTASAIGGAVRKGASDAIIDRLHRDSLGPDETHRLATKFVIRCEARKGDQRKVLFITGCDPYGITAVSVVALAERLAKEPPQSVGAVSPSMLYGADFIREYTTAAGLQWT
ncbi:MAG TPA: saccharopine dehydrogenase NADP-binding domain-containing protein [Blastocatellia bacterium]|nr:saccharopine dehydrogenase NADP-binding domain-containing protein [Blastocatellia bacterium]